MPKNTGIEWCDDSANSFQGCDGCWLWNHLDPKVRKCYAGQLVGRWKGRRGWTTSFDKITTFPGRMAEAAGWSDLTGTDRPDKPWLNGLPRIIFFGDMGDIFSNSIPFEYVRDEVISHMTSDNGKRHVWQILTKRPQRLSEFTRWLGDQGIEFPKNVWIGCSISKQIHVASVVHLLEAGNNETVRFISLEPQYERVDLREFLPKIDWLIQGGESGPKSLPFDPEWAIEMIQHCEDAGTAFFLKQVGSVASGGKNKGNHWEDWAPDLRVREMPLMPPEGLQVAIPPMMVATKPPKVAQQSTIKPSEVIEAIIAAASLRDRYLKQEVQSGRNRTQVDAGIKAVLTKRGAQ